MKILSLGTELIHADRRIDGRTEIQMDGHDEANIFYFKLSPCPECCTLSFG